MILNSLGLNVPIVDEETRKDRKTVLVNFFTENRFVWEFNRNVPFFLNKLIQCNDLTQGLKYNPWFEEKT